MTKRRKNRQRGMVDYSVTFAQCREGGHWWEYEKWDADAHAIHYLCVHGCKTMRVQIYDQATMRKVRSRYKYPGGYLMADTTRVNAAIECRKLLERLVTSRGLGFLRRERAIRGLRPVAAKEVAAKAE